VSLRFDLSVLADRVAEAVEAEEATLREEQSPWGLDSRAEVRLQADLAARLGAWYEVRREVHYPSTAGKPLSARMRCDLVLSERGRPLRVESSPVGLFDPPDSSGVGEALWLEIKTAHQFREGGVRHGGYGRQWREGVVADLRKMAAEPLIREAALLLIAFTESQAIVEKDLDLFEDLLARREVLAGFRQVRIAAIQDRIGHRVCTMALWPTIQRGDDS